MTFLSSDLAGLASFKAISWSYFQNLCALILSDNTVHFFDDHGNELFQNTVNRSCRATMLAFSPKVDILAIGWADGKITIWNNGQTQISATMLDGPVDIITWHPNECYLFTSTETGSLCIWDCSTIIVPMFQGKSETQFTSAVFTHTETPYIFLTTKEGDLFTIDPQEKTIKKVFAFESTVHCMSSCPAIRRIIVISGDNLMTQISYPPSLSKYSQIKLPSGSIPTLIKLKSDVYAYNISDAITLMNVQNENTYMLRMPNGKNVTAFGFISLTGTLYAATDDGHIMMWRSTMKGMMCKAGWSDTVALDCKANIDNIYASPYTNSFFAVCKNRRPLMFKLSNYQSAISHEVVVYQVASDLVQLAGQDPTRIAYPVERIGISNNYVATSSNISTDIFTIRSGGLVPFSRMNLNTPLVAISNETIFDCTATSLEVRNLQGTVKQTISLTNSPPTFIKVNGQFVCILCQDYSVFVFDISRRSPKLQFSTALTIAKGNFRIHDVSISCGGFCIAISIDIYEDGMWKPCPSLYLHSPQFDKTVTVDFDGRVPYSHQWDREDTRLLCVAVSPFSPDYESKMAGSIIVPLFISNSLDVYKQTTLSVANDSLLCGVDLPRVYIQSAQGVLPQSYVLPQFEGLDTADEASKKALMELNFYIAAGDIDSAFNAIRSIENKGIWHSLAQMCAQMRRIDLADLCFGKMEEGASAIILHKVKESGDQIQTLSLVDNQLKLYDEAKKVAADNRRNDILAQTQIALGEWEDAIKNVSLNDRIHLNLTEYQYARSLEIRGDLQGAIKHYEASGTIAVELPRLALQANDLKLFFSYIADRSVSEISPRMLIWIGRFYEAHGQIDQALEYFDYANSTKEKVRLLCCSDRWDEAAKIVSKSNSRAIITSYARLLMKRLEFYVKPENSNPQVDTDKMKHQIVELFRKARQFAQAIEFAVQYEMVDDILALSFSAPKALVCKAAQWFETQKEHKNAIILYSRCGRMNRALALCFISKQYDALEEIADTLNAKTDPNVLVRCGNYFIESERWSKAAQCYALAGQFDTVIQLCNEHNVKISSHVLQDLAENIKDKEILGRFAELCEQQGAFKIAASLYTKMKDILSAIKALIRSGDVDKVIKMAKLSRRKDGFILAANYLMTLNPRESENNFSTAVAFYSKAEAYDKLARFYESSAQMEIDEYQEYEKGLELLLKAVEILQEHEAPDRERILETLTGKVQLIKLYVGASQIVKEDPQKALAVCVKLLKTKSIEACMRPDDIYILMVQCYVQQGNFQGAYKILEDLRKSGTDITWFMEVDAIQKIYQACGDTFTPQEGGGSDYDDVMDISDDVE